MYPIVQASVVAGPAGMVLGYSILAAVLLAILHGLTGLLFGLPLTLAKDEEAPSEEESSARLQEKMKRKIAEKEGRARPADPKDMEVDTEDEDDEEEEREGAEFSREDKKRNRWREHKERAETAQREAQEARQRAEHAERQFQLLQNQHQQVLQSQPKKDEKDPYQEKLNAIETERQSLLERYQTKSANKTLTTEEYNSISKRASELEEAKYETIAERREARRGGNQSPQDIQAQIDRAQIQARYPDVYQPNGNNPQSARIAQHFVNTYQNLVLAGKPAGFATGDLAADETRRQFGLQRARPENSPALRERFNGVSSGGKGPSAEKPRTVTVTPEEQKLAVKMYPRGADGRKLTTKESVQIWARKVKAKMVK